MKIVYYTDFREKFIISSCIPTKLFYGNQIIWKFNVHYGYGKTSYTLI